MKEVQIHNGVPYATAFGCPCVNLALGLRPQLLDLEPLLTEVAPLPLAAGGLLFNQVPQELMVKVVVIKDLGVVIASVRFVPFFRNRIIFLFGIFRRGVILGELFN